MSPKFEIAFFCKALVANNDYPIFVKCLSQSANDIIIDGEFRSEVPITLQNISNDMDIFVTVFDARKNIDINLDSKTWDGNQWVTTERNWNNIYYKNEETIAYIGCMG